MEKRHKIIWSVTSVLIFLFFLGACGKKEETPQKSKVVSKKVVSKKVSKPVPKPKKVEKSQADIPEKQKAEVESKGAPTTSKKPEATTKQTEKDEKGKKKEVLTTTLSAKKKPAFKPKSEISTKSDYRKASADVIQVAKKQDEKTSEPTKPTVIEKKDSAVKAGKEKETKLKDSAISETAETSAKKDSAKDRLKDTTPTSEEKKESVSAEVKKSEENKESEKVAKLTPSKTLAPVRIDPLTKDFTYNPSGKIDPFSSMFKVKSESKKKRKRFPLTPLEKRDISQFKLVGIILSAKGNKAIVKEASGKGYVISRGTYIGVNDGRVVKILKDRVICEEEVENLFGQIETKARILKLKKPPGAL
jgi:type IV pilus assembly protein PilP